MIVLLLVIPTALPFALPALLALGAVASRFGLVQEWQAERLGKVVGLGVPVELEGTMRRRMADRLLFGCLGGLVGFVVADALLVAAARTDGATASWPLLFAAPPSLQVVRAWALLAASIAGFSIGTVLAAFAAAFEADDRPRIARLAPVRLSSYMPVVARLLAWVLVLPAVASAVLVSGTVEGLNSVSLTLLVLLVVVALVCLGSFEILGRRLTARGQPAATTDELVWEDAWRSSALRSILEAGLVSLFMTAMAPVAWSSSRGGPQWFWIPVALFTVGYLLLAAMLKQTRTWYLGTLWPGARRRTPDEELERTGSPS
jgi:hypothetical protein